MCGEALGGLLCLFAVLGPIVCNCPQVALACEVQKFAAARGKAPHHSAGRVVLRHDLAGLERDDHAGEGQQDVALVTVEVSEERLDTVLDGPPEVGRRNWVGDLVECWSS